MSTIALLGTNVRFPLSRVTPPFLTSPFLTSSSNPKRVSILLSKEDSCFSKKAEIILHKTFSEGLQKYVHIEERFLNQKDLNERLDAISRRAIKSETLVLGMHGTDESMTVDKERMQVCDLKTTAEKIKQVVAKDGRVCLFSCNVAKKRPFITNQGLKYLHNVASYISMCSGVKTVASNSVVLAARIALKEGEIEFLDGKIKSVENHKVFFDADNIGSTICQYANWIEIVETAYQHENAIKISIRDRYEAMKRSLQACSWGSLGKHLLYLYEHTEEFPKDLRDCIYEKYLGIAKEVLEDKSFWIRIDAVASDDLQNFFEDPITHNVSSDIEECYKHWMRFFNDEQKELVQINVGSESWERLDLKNPLDRSLVIGGYQTFCKRDKSTILAYVDLLLDDLSRIFREGDAELKQFVLEVYTETMDFFMPRNLLSIKQIEEYYIQLDSSDSVSYIHTFICFWRKLRLYKDCDTEIVLNGSPILLNVLNFQLLAALEGDNFTFSANFLKACKDLLYEECHLERELQKSLKEALKQKAVENKKNLLKIIDQAVGQEDFEVVEAAIVLLGEKLTLDREDRGIILSSIEAIILNYYYQDPEELQEEFIDSLERLIDQCFSQMTASEFRVWYSLLEKTDSDFITYEIADSSSEHARLYADFILAYILKYVWMDSPPNKVVLHKLCSLVGIACSVDDVSKEISIHKEMIRFIKQHPGLISNRTLKNLLDSLVSEGFVMETFSAYSEVFFEQNPLLWGAYILKVLDQKMSVEDETKSYSIELLNKLSASPLTAKKISNKNLLNMRSRAMNSNRNLFSRLCFKQLLYKNKCGQDEYVLPNECENKMQKTS